VAMISQVKRVHIKINAADLCAPSELFVGRK